MVPERCAIMDDFDLFNYNEMCSVSALSNAAALAGFVTQTEYVLTKHGLTQGRPKRNGRCDLWLGDLDSKYSWGFEAKQHFAVGGLRDCTFNKHLDNAANDAKTLNKNEADRLVGLLIVTPHTDADVGLLSSRMNEISTQADFIFRIDRELRPIWLAFKIID